MLSKTSIEWPLLLNGIEVGYCNTVSVGSHTLQISLSLSLSTLSENQIALSETAEGSVRKGIIRNFEKFTGKHLCQGLFNNVTG